MCIEGSSLANAISLCFVFSIVRTFFFIGKGRDPGTARSKLVRVFQNFVSPGLVRSNRFWSVDSWVKDGFIWNSFQKNILAPFTSSAIFQLVSPISSSIRFMTVRNRRFTFQMVRKKRYRIGKATILFFYFQPSKLKPLLLTEIQLKP